MDVVILYSTYELLNLVTERRRRYVQTIYLTGLASHIGLIVTGTALVQGRHKRKGCQ